MTLELVDDNRLDAGLLASHARVTDSNLLALARANQGCLATLDARPATDAAAQGQQFLLVI